MVNSLTEIEYYSDEHIIREFLKRFAEKQPREGLEETPTRVAKAWKFWCSGYEQDPKDILKEFKDGGEVYDEMLMQGNIDVFSHCEHHICPMFGKAYVAYIPNGKVVGLSKLARVVEIYARRLQVQERLTDQIADTLWDNLQPKGVGVLLQLRHMCVESRGIQKVGSITTSSALRGCMKDEPECRAEFFSLVQLSQNSVKL